MSDYHFQGPDASDPDLEGPLDTLDVFKVDAFPPASPGRFPPKQKELLGHANGGGILRTNVSAST